MRLIAAIGLLLLGTSAAAYCPEFLRNQTACSCVEYVDGAIIRCNGPDGPMMVEKLKKTQTEVRELALENANILEIGAQAFRNLRIKKLVLDNNRIKTIQRDAFQGLETILQELSINNNKLTQIPTGIAGGIARICNIGADAFEEIKPNLQNIILDNNCLKKLPTKALENMHQLIGLHIKYNKIDKLSKHSLQHMNSLTMLSLSGNNISSVDKEFLNNVTNLRYMYLSENIIKNVESSILKQFNKVEIFDLSYNNIPDLTAKQFSVMESLQHLNLEGNRIKEIAPGAFASTPLILLWLPHNCLTNISSDIFQGVPFLKQLSLAYNNILNVQPYSFAHLANLHTIDLSHNKILSLQKSSLMGPDFLAVRVEENPLVCNQEDGFHVMNGHEAINLTTEVNAICKTDYMSTLKNHKCPTRGSPPERPTCCNKNKTPASTTARPASTTPAATTTTEGAAKMDEQQLVAAMEAAAKMARNEQNIANAAAAARKLNMDRFMRLSRKPTEGAMRSYSKMEGGHQPTFLERQRGLVDAPIEFNADAEGESVHKEEAAAVPAPSTTAAPEVPKVAAPVID
ncbi:Leucine Rich Repeat family protein [Aphelenchoides fujianensis]|nr:Leucine Rich Repeat family protein [Aphelenchoides fujianensis]